MPHSTGDPAIRVTPDEAAAIRRRAARVAELLQEQLDKRGTPAVVLDQIGIRRSGTYIHIGDLPLDLAEQLLTALTHP